MNNYKIFDGALYSMHSEKCENRLCNSRRYNIITKNYTELYWNYTDYASILPDYPLIIPDYASIISDYTAEIIFPGIIAEGGSHG